MSARKIETPMQLTHSPDEVSGWDLEKKTLSQENARRSFIFDLVVLAGFSGFFLLRMFGF
jgi:hypothetical protein